MIICTFPPFLFLLAKLTKDTQSRSSSRYLHTHTTSITGTVRTVWDFHIYLWPKSQTSIPQVSLLTQVSCFALRFSMTSSKWKILAGRLFSTDNSMNGEFPIQQRSCLRSNLFVCLKQDVSPSFVLLFALANVAQGLRVFAMKPWSLPLRLSWNALSQMGSRCRSRMTAMTPAMAPSRALLVNYPAWYGQDWDK